MIDRGLGFSLWLDFIERDYLASKFVELVNNGIVNGATSNPSIFASAIMSSPAYVEQLKSLEGKSSKEKYEALAIEDIKTAARILRATYDEGNDGYISIEVDPFLSSDTEGTIAEGKRLFAAIGEPNVMIKIPATEAGYDAMYALMSTGIPVNATLIFSPAQAIKCLTAMRKGLDEFESSGGLRVEAVISIFVSRFDRLLDATLAQKGIEPARTGIYNAAKIYNLIEQNHTPSVRTLFASTGVKGDELPPCYYVRELYAPRSVNTAPLTTIEAYMEAPQRTGGFPIPDDEIERYFDQLAAKGIDMDAIYAQLMSEGLEAFENAFNAMLEKI